MIGSIFPPVGRFPPPISPGVRQTLLLGEVGWLAGLLGGRLAAEVVGDPFGEAGWPAGPPRIQSTCIAIKAF